VDGVIALPSRHRQIDNQSYRSIEGPKEGSLSDVDSPSESEVSQSSDDDDADTTLLTSHQEKTKELEQGLFADPSSVPTWLSLLAHSLSQIPVTSKNAVKARSEIALSILSRALSSSPSNAYSVALRLKYLQAGEEVWPEQRLKEEWDGLLSTTDSEILMSWFEWKIRKGHGGMEGVIEEAAKLLKIMADDVDWLRLVWRTAVVLKQAGSSCCTKAFVVLYAYRLMTCQVSQSGQ